MPLDPSNGVRIVGAGAALTAIVLCDGPAGSARSEADNVIQAFTLHCGGFPRVTRDDPTPHAHPCGLVTH